MRRASNQNAPALVEAESELVQDVYGFTWGIASTARHQPSTQKGCHLLGAE